MNEHQILLRELGQTLPKGSFISRELDLSQLEDSRCVAAQFGGPNQMKIRYPGLHTLYQRSLAQRNALNATNVGFQDKAKILALGYDAATGTAYAMGTMTLTAPAQRLYLTLDVYAGDTLVAHNARFFSACVAGEIEIQSPEMPPLKDGEEYTAYLHATWEPGKNGLLRSQVASDQASAGAKDLVKNLMDPVPVTQGNPSLVKRHHGHLYGQLSRSPSPCPSPAQTKEYGIELSVQGSNKVFSAFGGAQGGAATATAAAGGGAAAATQSHIGIALGTAVGIAVLAGTAVSIASAERERPQRQGALQITGICWDHQGDPSTGSLHYHKGGENLPASMFDVPAGGRLDTLCVLVPSKLTQPKVDVTLHYSGEGTQAKSGTLRAFDLTAGGLLGNQSANYHISPGQTLTVSLPFDKDKLPRGVYINAPISGSSGMEKLL